MQVEQWRLGLTTFGTRTLSSRPEKKLSIMEINQTCCFSANHRSAIRHILSPRFAGDFEGGAAIFFSANLISTFSLLEKQTCPTSTPLITVLF